MYTQCPDCGTVFKVTADALRAAQGTVRCGICSSSFNALEYLSEEPLLRPHEERPAAEDTITVEELPGTEHIELSGQADQAVAAAGPGQEAGDAPPATAGDRGEAPTGDDGGDARPGGDADGDDIALEFHGSAEDLEKLFAENPAELFGLDGEGVEDLRGSISEIAASGLGGIEVVEESMPERADEEDAGAHPGHIAAVLAFRRPGDVAAAAGQFDADGEDDPLSRTDEYPVLAQDESAATDPGDGGEQTLQILIPEELRRAAEEPGTPADAFAGLEEHESPHGRRWPLVAGLVVLALALAAQAVHFWRDDLVRHPLAGPWLLQAYAWAGLDLPPPVDLSAFELRQLGAANDPAQAGRLKVRASIVNHAPFAQPYPILRLSLQDRFGTTVGVRNLEPDEYLPGGSGGALLAPARRADAEIVFVDPGRDAVGYEVDVCIRDAAGLRCGTEPAGRRP